MLMADFATAVKYNLNIKVFVFNNSKLGLIQMEQEVHGNPEFETDLHNPDYAAFANSCGGEGYEVHEHEELAEAIDKALASSKPCIVNVFVNPGEVTLPPRITAAEAVGYTKAKIREYFTRSKRLRTHK
jgi:pyruvate oxidase